MGSVKFHVSGDGELIRELIKRGARHQSGDFDIDYEDPKYEVVTCERVEPEDYFTSAFDQNTYYWDDEHGEYGEHILWAETTGDQRDEAIEALREELEGQLVLLQVNLAHEQDDGATTLSMLVDELLGHVEVLEIWHHPQRSHPDTRGLIERDT